MTKEEITVQQNYNRTISTWHFKMRMLYWKLVYWLFPKMVLKRFVADVTQHMI